MLYKTIHLYTCKSLTGPWHSLISTYKSDISFFSLALGGIVLSHILWRLKMGAEISLICLVHLVGKTCILSQWYFFLWSLYYLHVMITKIGLAVPIPMCNSSQYLSLFMALQLTKLLYPINDRQRVIHLMIVMTLSQPRALNLRKNLLPWLLIHLRHLKNPTRILKIWLTCRRSRMLYSTCKAWD